MSFGFQAMNTAPDGSAKTAIRPASKTSKGSIITLAARLGDLLPPSRRRPRP